MGFHSKATKGRKFSLHLPRATPQLISNNITKTTDVSILVNTCRFLGRVRVPHEIIDKACLILIRIVTMIGKHTLQKQKILKQKK